MTGKRAMAQVVAAAGPSPTAAARGPLTASRNATAAAATKPAKVSSNWTGRNFQAGRPSCTS